MTHTTISVSFSFSICAIAIAIAPDGMADCPTEESGLVLCKAMGYLD